MTKKPQLSFWQIWNLSFGFLGVQFGFALQNANVSRILQTLGAEPEKLPMFWLVAPIIGLIIQPIIGKASDNTWNKLGRRFPYILAGAVISVLAMFFMPNAAIATAIMSPLVFGALMLCFMDGSFNVTFQPFRSLVSDMLPEEQKNVGFSIQSFLINVGAVLGAVLPYILTWMGVSNSAEPGHVPNSVIWSFYIGGSVLILSVLVTIFTTKEYTPEQMKSFEQDSDGAVSQTKSTKGDGIFKLLAKAPSIMWQLAAVQFFAWFAFYIFWTLGLPGMSEQYWGTTDANTSAYQEAGNWFGIINGAYGLFAALFALCMPKLIKILSRKVVYALALACGGLGFLSVAFMTNSNLIILSMVGVGIAWAAILALPFAILSSSLPQDNMGGYLGLFNFTVSVPQIISGLLGGVIMTHVCGGHPIYMYIVGGVAMLIGAVCAMMLKDNSRD